MAKLAPIPIRNVYYLLCYAWGEWDAGEVVDLEQLGRMDHVHDLFGHILARGVLSLARRGVDRGYAERQVELAGVRGKLDLGATLKRGLLSQGRAICTVEEFTPDVLHNRILLATLHRLYRTSGLDRRVREDVRLAMDRLPGVGRVPLTLGLFRRVQLDRNQRQYRFLLSVCRLVLESTLLSEAGGEMRFADFRRNRKRMWRLFELFVANFLVREQAEFQVSSQIGIDWFEARERSPRALELVPRMLPDVLAQSKDRRIVLDTKFYSKPVGVRFGRPRLRSSNLYQMFAYLSNRQAAYPVGPRHEGILLYASIGEDLRIDLMLQGFRVQVRTLDLSRPWPQVRGELLGLLQGEEVQVGQASIQGGS